MENPGVLVHHPEVEEQLTSWCLLSRMGGAELLGGSALLSLSKLRGCELLMADSEDTRVNLWFRGYKRYTETCRGDTTLVLIYFRRNSKTCSKNKKSKKSLKWD